MKNKYVCLSAIVLAASLSTAKAADWYAPQEPFAVYGNTYYVGTGGISALLLTSPAGHILIDAGAPKSPPMIVEHIRKLGFKVEDIRYILNSHAHHDHAGGIAELQKLSGATVLASPPSLYIFSSGQPDNTDPQFRDLVPMTPVTKMRAIHNGEVIRLGPIALTAHFTPGHTKGGTSWTWQSTENGRMANMVYADSLYAMSANGVRFSGNPGYPNAQAEVEGAIATLESLKCDVLVSAHPELGGLWERKAKQPALGNAAFIDKDACRDYAAKARAKLAQTLAEDKAAIPKHELINSAAPMARDVVASVAPSLFEQKTYTASNGIVLPYRILTPMTLEPGVRYPLVLQLHGSGGIGTDNLTQLDRLAKSWAMPEIRARYNTYVLVPQLPVRSANYGPPSPDQYAEHSTALIAALELVEKFAQESPVDSARIYALGFSMGGSAAWLAPILKPDLFAAIMPISGIAPKNTSAEALQDLPIWVMHGNADTENPIFADHRIAKLIATRGGQRIFFREYDGLDHQLPADLYPGYWWRNWLFDQHRH